MSKSLLGWVLVAIGGIVMFAQATQSDVALSALARCRAGGGCLYLGGVMIGTVIPVVVVAYGLKLLRGGGTPGGRA